MRQRSERSASPRAVAETPPPVRTSELDEGVFRTELGAGADVWSERMESMRSVAVGFWFRSGAAHDADESAGLAHLLEHMVFKGTERRTARELAAEIEDLGGSLDAYTTHEHTCLQARVPEDALPVAIDVLGDLAFHARLDSVDLELERQVVLEELARAEDTPDDIVFDLAAEFLFDGHPYGRPVLGRRETVETLDAAALRDRYASAFRPGNLVVAAAGRVDHEELLGLLGGVLPATGGDRMPRIAAPESVGRGRREITRSGGRQSHIVACAAGVSATDPLRHAVTLVDTALGGGMGSRLFQHIREELGLAYAVYGFRSYYMEGGQVGAYVGTRPEVAERARRALLEELGSLAADGLTPEELVTTRKQLEGQVVLSLESPASRMYRLASLGLSGEPYRSLDRVMADIRAIGPEDARAAADLYDPDGLAVLELSPA